MAERRARLGRTAQLAEAFGVHRAAVEQWKLRYPLFAQAIKEGKAPADANVAATLYMRAVGFEREAVKIFCNADGKVTREKYMEYFPPEVTACRLWLMNRVPGLWRDKRELEITDKRQLLEHMSEDQLIERIMQRREQRRSDGAEPSYGFRVRLGRERTPVARCSWCTMPIVEAEVDPRTGKPVQRQSA